MNESPYGPGVRKPDIIAATGHGLRENDERWKEFLEKVGDIATAPGQGIWNIIEQWLDKRDAERMAGEEPPPDEEDWWVKPTDTRIEEIAGGLAEDEPMGASRGSKPPRERDEDREGIGWPMMRGSGGPYDIPHGQPVRPSVDIPPDEPIGRDEYRGEAPGKSPEAVVPGQKEAAPSGFSIPTRVRREGFDPGEEMLQEALVAAGYPLPQYGVDGMAGEETFEALNQALADEGVSDRFAPGDVIPGWVIGMLEQMK